MNLLLYFQVFNETVARDSYAGVKKWYSSARHDYWSWCGNEHAFKIRQNDHQKQRSSQFGDAQCTRKQYQVCSVTQGREWTCNIRKHLGSTYNKNNIRYAVWLFFPVSIQLLERNDYDFYVVWSLSFQIINAKLPLQPLTFMASKISLFPITKELFGLFCWSDFWYQKFSAPKDHLGSIQKFLKIQIYKDRGCWPFWGAGGGTKSNVLKCTPMQELSLF